MTQSTVVFIDYENARHYARRQPGVADGHFEPWSLGQAICDLHNRHAPDVPLECGEVRVYLGVSNEHLDEATWRDYERYAQTWGKSRPVKVHTPQRQCRDKTWVVKEFYTQLSVDLLNWALDVSRNCREPEVAVLFSADRDCAPALRAVAAILRSHPTSRVDMAGWLEHGQGQASFGRVVDIPDLHLEQHLLTWGDYRGALV